MGLRSLCADCVWHGPEVGPPHQPRAHETFEQMARSWFYQPAFIYGTVTLFGAQQDWEYYAERAVVRSLYIVGLEQVAVHWTYDKTRNNVTGCLLNFQGTELNAESTVKLLEGFSPKVALKLTVDAHRRVHSGVGIPLSDSGQPLSGLE